MHYLFIYFTHIFYNFVFIIFSIIYKVPLNPINGVNGYILILSKLGLLTCKSKIELYFLSNVVPYPNNSNSS